MKLHILTIFFIILEHINRALTQGIPLSPCPKLFQYRFDGAEWFGLLSVRNPDIGQALHLRVTLSMRGKPTTDYLGEIELLTRGQFLSDSPVMYKVKFPKHHFPPKVLQITTNNQIVCLGAADHGIFVTQIQLEHTRKFAFIPDDITMQLPPDFVMPTPTAEGAAATPTKDSGMLPASMGFDTKHFSLPTLDINLFFHFCLLQFNSISNPVRTPNDICGRIDDRIRFQVLHAMKAGLTPGNQHRNENLNSAGLLLPRIVEGSGDATMPLITSDIEDANFAPTFAADGSMANDELPSITRGAWPWLAAIYVNNLTSLAYQCGGTLVSKRVVISSAHCFQLFKKRYTANEVLVFLGRHNLKNWNEEGSLAAPVDDIFIHPDFNSHLNTYDADIAVLILKHEVRFNTFIRPACLWKGSTKQQYIEGEHGIVVGWGLANINATSAPSSSSTVPRVVDAPIVSNAACFKANDKYRNISSNRTFCAGFVSAVTPTIATQTMGNKAELQRKHKSKMCTGDSGAGLMIFKNDRWMLRGTVSAMVPVEGASRNATSGRCSDNQYVVYTDVAKFLDWIFAFII
ncbi:serine protease gd-like [Teleopsis dalmanni]|uniref:serine protease gd-like n=1 Tax=Teleopsis dalmanni TaxID=139649 RepID=UPI0018CEDE64|nr:serine protease gd-like [Teleopsis dalmanni]